jgi:hypothetical protein
MISTPSGDNWLDARSFACPHCQEALYSVIRSPLFDEWQLYCERCPRRVEISFYDSVARRIGDALSAYPLPAGERAVTHLREMERWLKPCVCGGRFRHDAPRRCHVCHNVVLDSASDTDLWPAVYGVDAEERDLTEGERAYAAQFEAAHVRRHDIWLSA